MTTTLEPPRTRSTVGPFLPQVNLLPPEVRAARGLRKIKRWLAVGLVVTLLACAGVYALGLLAASQAADELVTAQDETARLQTEAAKYAEVPQVLSALDGATAVRTLGMATEVEWKGYLDAIAAVLPADVTIETLAITGATPMTPAALPADPLQGPSVGLITFTGQTTTLPDTAAWVDALNSVPGFADAWVSTATVGELEAAISYTVASTVQFTDAAYAGRFAAEGSK